MKPFLNTVLILDQDINASKKMITFIEKIFSHLYAPHDPEKYIDGLDAAQPDAVFINLSLRQREASFDFLQKVLQRPEPKPLIYGYVDRFEPELKALAVENGVQDLFVHPFNQELIMKKIQDLVMKDEMYRKNLLYTPLRKPLKAQVDFTLNLIEVDENGCTFRCNHYINKGTELFLSSPLVKEIFGVEEIEMLVTKTWMTEDELANYIFTEPKHNIESTSAALRRFILAKSS